VIVYALGVAPSLVSAYAYARIAHAGVKFGLRIVGAAIVSGIAYLLIPVSAVECAYKGAPVDFVWTVIGFGACAGAGSAFLCALIEEMLEVDAVQASSAGER
jgi:hypothetical protein